MALYKTNFYDLVGAVRQYRPDMGQVAVEKLIQDRVRQVIDSKIYWADLLQRGVLRIPAAYTTGTISLTPGSATVDGVANDWPVADVVNTTLDVAIEELGYVRATPHSMANISADRLLLLDLGTANQEVVAVISTEAGTFEASFAYPHAAGCSVTCSSLAGRQFRRDVTDPIFTVQGVTATTQLLIDQPWGGAAVAGSPYRIVGMYHTLATDLKDILYMIDPSMGVPIRLHVTQDELNWKDAQRTYSDQPQELADLTPNAAGNMQYEIWPCPQIVYQLPYVYTRQWPEMVNPTDRPPSFINPSVFVHGAIADALRWKNRPRDDFHNPQLAREFEAKYNEGLEGAKNADESRARSTLMFYLQGIVGPVGTQYWINHLDWLELYGG